MPERTSRFHFAWKPNKIKDYLKKTDQLFRADYWAVDSANLWISH